MPKGNTRDKNFITQIRFNGGPFQIYIEFRGFLVARRVNDRRGIGNIRHLIMNRGVHEKE